MKSYLKDFITDIKDAFNVLPEYLGISIVLSILFAIVGGIDFGFDCLCVLIGAWAIIFILFPIIILILSIFNRK